MRMNLNSMFRKIECEKPEIQKEQRFLKNVLMQPAEKPPLTEEQKKLIRILIPTPF